MLKWLKRRWRERGIITVETTLPEHKAGLLAGDEELEAVYREIKHTSWEGDDYLELRIYLSPGDWSKFESQPFYRDLKKFMEEEAEWKCRWCEPIHCSNNVISLRELQFCLSPRDSSEIENRQFYRDLLAYLDNLRTLRSKSDR